MLFINIRHRDMFLLYIKAEHMEKHPYTDDKISHNILTGFFDDVTSRWRKIFVRHVLKNNITRIHIYIIKYICLS